MRHVGGGLRLCRGFIRLEQMSEKWFGQLKH